MKTNNFLLTASVALAMALMFSCSSDDGDSGGGGGCKGNDIANYKTVPIGTQVWMAENMNCVAEGSKCYDDDPENCDKYGRLYSWVTAMALPPNCEEISNSCASQISTKHRGICPSGWHIPSDADWDILMSYVQTDNGETYTNGSEASVAGKYLKATSWVTHYDQNNEDKYDFAALPGGYSYRMSGDVHFDNADYGYWWSSTEEGSDSDKVYYRLMRGNRDYVERDYSYKFLSNLYSVRCVKD